MIESNEESKVMDTLTLGNEFGDENLEVKSMLNISNDPTNSYKECLSYVCVPRQQRGKFMPKKAIDLGCKPGVHFKILSEGEEVKLDDGTIVKPE